MIEFEGITRMPKQEAPQGAKAGYIGEVEVYDRPEAGSSNSVADVATAESRVKALKRASEQAEKALAEARKAETKSEAATEDKARATSGNKGR